MGNGKIGQRKKGRYEKGQYEVSVGIQESLALASMARDDPPTSSTASSTVQHGGRNAR